MNKKLYSGLILTEIPFINIAAFLEKLERRDKPEISYKRHIIFIPENKILQ